MEAMPLHEQVEDRLISQILINSQEMASDGFQLERRNWEELLAIQEKINWIVMTLFLNAFDTCCLKFIFDGQEHCQTDRGIAERR